MRRIAGIAAALILLAALPAGLAGASKTGYPCTQYKPADIARAKANIAQFEWAQKTHQALRDKAAYYLKLDRQKLRSLIPDKTPLAAIKCPVCGKAPWSWYTLLDEGEILECTDCRTRWKWNASDRSETWNIPAVFRYYRLEYAVGGLTAAALLYQLDGDRAMADKAAVIIERFAEVFKGYRVNMVHRNQWLDHPDPYYAKIAGWKLREMSFVQRVLQAYDFIHDSGALSAAQIDKIDRDLVAYTRDYLIQGYGPGGPASPDSLQDQGPSWWVLAACGALLGDRATLDLMVDAFEQVFDPANGLFYEDGVFFQGSPAYQNQFLGSVATVPEVIAGNTTRGIYGNPRCALLEKCYTWTLDFLYPDGTVPPINDAHVGGLPSRRENGIAARRFGNRQALRYLADNPARQSDEDRSFDALFADRQAEEEAGAAYAVDSAHFEGAGLMVLRHGKDAASRAMAFLDYGAYEPPNKPPYHKHRDYLNLGLWAAGREMLSEMGYAMTPPWVQKWQVSPPAHNTVLEAAAQNEGGRALLWHITPGPKLAEAGLPPANSRFIALLPRAEGEPVIVDIFRMAGDPGQFTWTVHARTGGLVVRGLEGWEDVEAEAPLRQARRAGSSAGTVGALWKFPNAPESGLKLLLPSFGESSITASACPPEEDEIKAAHLMGGTLKAGAVLPYRGHLQVKKQGPEAVFAAVYVPFRGAEEPQAEVICADLGAGAVALRIDIAGERFAVIHSPRMGKYEYEGLTLDGRVGIASMARGKARGPDARRRPGPVLLREGHLPEHHRQRLQGSRAGRFTIIDTARPRRPERHAGRPKPGLLPCSLRLGKKGYFFGLTAAL